MRETRYERIMREDRERQEKMDPLLTVLVWLLTSQQAKDAGIVVTNCDGPEIALDDKDGNSYLLTLDED